MMPTIGPQIYNSPTTYFGSLINKDRIKSLAISDTLLKYSLSNWYWQAATFAYVSCLSSPKNGEAPLRRIYVNTPTAQRSVPKLSGS